MSAQQCEHATGAVDGYVWQSSQRRARRQCGGERSAPRGHQQRRVQSMHEDRCLFCVSGVSPFTQMALLMGLCTTALAFFLFFFFFFFLLSFFLSCLRECPSGETIKPRPLEYAHAARLHVKDPVVLVGGWSTMETPN